MCRVSNPSLRQWCSHSALPPQILLVSGSHPPQWLKITIILLFKSMQVDTYPFSLVFLHFGLNWLGQENKDQQVALGPLPFEVSSTASVMNLYVHLLPSETSDQLFLEANDIHICQIFISAWKTVTHYWAHPCKNEAGFLRWGRHSSFNLILLQCKESWDPLSCFQYRSCGDYCQRRQLCKPVWRRC